MYREELELAKKAAVAAGDFLRQRREIRVEAQEGKDVKLSSDKYSEKIIMDILGTSGFPILSEEYGANGELEENYWIIDPLDGTVNYFKGMDELACVSIAFWAAGVPVVGVVYRFMCDELFWGEIESGAYLNGERVKVASTERIAQAVLATGFPVKRSYETGALERFIGRVQRFRKIRMLGAAAVMGVFVACGRLDAYMEEEIMIWDVAGAAAIVKAAGGYADIRLLKDDKCICCLFASEKLWEDYNAQGI